MGTHARVFPVWELGEEGSQKSSMVGSVVTVGTRVAAGPVVDRKTRGQDRQKVQPEEGSALSVCQRAPQMTFLYY